MGESWTRARVSAGSAERSASSPEAPRCVFRVSITRSRLEGPSVGLAEPATGSGWRFSSCGVAWYAPGRISRVAETLWQTIGSSFRVPRTRETLPVEFRRLWDLAESFWERLAGFANRPKAAVSEFCIGVTLEWRVAGVSGVTETRWRPLGAIPALSNLSRDQRRPVQGSGSGAKAPECLFGVVPPCAEGGAYPFSRQRRARGPFGSPVGSSGRVEGTSPSGVGAGRWLRRPGCRRRTRVAGVQLGWMEATEVYGAKRSEPAGPEPLQHVGQLARSGLVGLRWRGRRRHALDRRRSEACRGTTAPAFERAR